jgi:hypothetical protein
MKNIIYYIALISLPVIVGITFYIMALEDKRQMPPICICTGEPVCIYNARPTGEIISEKQCYCPEKPVDCK